MSLCKDVILWGLGSLGVAGRICKSCNHKYIRDGREDGHGGDVPLRLADTSRPALQREAAAEAYAVGVGDGDEYGLCYAGSLSTEG